MNVQGSRSREQLNGLKGEYGNIAFLLFLYVLQGIPLGITSAVPLFLTKKKVSYSDQAHFSFASWPFSLKLMWAPIVDSIFWRSVGRRKSWLVPVQLGIGFFMIALSKSVITLLPVNSVEGIKPNIPLLTLIFLTLNFLAATQDIVVDGWALTMLSRRNVGYASTCNTVGQTAGFFIGYIIFVALESADFCNKYLRTVESQSAEGIVSFESFLLYNGVIFIVVTILIALLRAEKSSPSEIGETESGVITKMVSRRRGTDSIELARDVQETCSNSDDAETNQASDMSVKESYLMLLKIMKLPSFKLLAVVLLTSKIGFSAPDAVSGFKLIDAGVSQENLALLAVPMVPLQIILPWLISRATCGPTPLNIYIKAYPYRLLFGLVFPLVIYVTPMMKLEEGGFPFHYYAFIILIYGLHQITLYCLFVATMAFHASISDPTIGGTYMTLLNTIANIGGNWPATLAIYLVDLLTIKDCRKDCMHPESLNRSRANAIDSHPTSAPTSLSSINGSSLIAPTCEDSCEIRIDGYYIECVGCVILGFLWIYWGKSKLRRLQELPASAWSVALATKTR